MRRLLGGLFIVPVLVAAPRVGATAGAATVPPGTSGTGTVTAPLVGFEPLVAPWWLRQARRSTAVSHTMTVLYLADGSTPEVGRGFAMTRGPAVGGAETCGASLGPLGVRRGPFRGAVATQSGGTTIVRSPLQRAGEEQAVLVARGMTQAEVSAIAVQARAVRGGVLAPRTVPRDLTISGLAPVDPMLTGGRGTDFRLVRGFESNQVVRVHALTAIGPAHDAVRFFRATSVPMACAPGRYVVTMLGPVVVTTTSSSEGDAARVAAVVRPVSRAGFATNVAWVDQPGPTQLARRCQGPGILPTVAGRNHGRVWGVGFRADAGAPICVAGRSGRTDVAPVPRGTDGVTVSLELSETCGLALVAGRTPAHARRVVIRAGTSRAQVGHLRAVRVHAAGPADPSVWAALVRTPATPVPAVNVRAYDQRGRLIGRARLPARSTRRCRAGRPIPTTTTTTGTTTTAPG